MPYKIRYRKMSAVPSGAGEDHEEIFKTIEEARVAYSTLFLESLEQARSYNSFGGGSGSRIFFYHPPARCNRKGELTLPRDCPHCHKKIKTLNRVGVGIVLDEIALTGKNPAYPADEPFPLAADWKGEQRALDAGEIVMENFGYPKFLEDYPRNFMCPHCETVIEGITDDHFSYS